MEQPSTPPSAAPPAADEAKDKKVGYVNLAVWGALTVLFCCGGAVITGALGAESESDGVDAAMAAAGPACCAISGLIGTLPGLFALKGKTGLKVGLPIALGVAGGIGGVLAILVFFEAIWPSL